MNIGLFFGSFNPIHIGHLILAQTFLNEGPVEQVWFVVSPQNPFKQRSPELAFPWQRLEMVQIALQSYSNLLPSDVEFGLPLPSYTVDTLAFLSTNYPQYHFYLLMGADNLPDFHKWKHYETIYQNYPVYVYPRKVNNTCIKESWLRSHYPAMHYLNAPLIEISSTYIRKLRKHGKSIRFFVPDAVLQYIEKHHLYES